MTIFTRLWRILSRRRPDSPKELQLAPTMPPPPTDAVYTIKHSKSPEEVAEKDRVLRQDLVQVRGDLSRIDARLKALEVGAGLQSKEYRPPLLVRRESNGNGHPA